MSHPALGLPPADARAATRPAAGRLRANRLEVASAALARALRRDPGLRERYDDRVLRLFARDGLRHVEQLARALESGEDRFAVQYVESIAPVYRHRHVPIGDVETLFLGLQDAAIEVTGEDARPEIERVMQAVLRTLDRPRHLPGDRPRNRLIAFVWKASGMGGW
jgi:hypothetical protein